MRGPNVFPLQCNMVLVQVGNWTVQRNFWGHVEDFKGRNPTYSVNITDGASDLGGQVSLTPPPPPLRNCCSQQTRLA